MHSNRFIVAHTLFQSNLAYIHSQNSAIVFKDNHFLLTLFEVSTKHRKSSNGCLEGLWKMIVPEIYQKISFSLSEKISLPA